MGEREKEQGIYNYLRRSLRQPVALASLCLPGFPLERQISPAGVAAAAASTSPRNKRMDIVGSLRVRAFLVGESNTARSHEIFFLHCLGFVQVSEASLQAN